MTDRNDILNKSFDALLSAAAEEAAYEAGKELLEKEVQKHEFSREHTEKMKRIFRKEKLKEKIRFISKYKGIAAIFIAVIIASGIAIPNAKAIKSIFMNYVFDKDNPGTSFTFDNSPHNSYSNGKIIFHYLPLDFELTYEDESLNFMSLSFEKGDKWIDFSTNPITGKLSIHTEGGEIEEVYINNIRGIYCETERLNSIVWNNDTYSLTLMGNIEKEELLKIANNIEFKD